MAGTLVIDTLKTSTGVLATQNGMTGIAKAWVNFNGTTTPGTIRASMNVSSVTKNGTGDYTVNFSTPMPDTNYAWSGAACNDGAYTPTVYEQNTLTARTTSLFRIGVYNVYAVAAADRTIVMVNVFSA